MSVIARHIPVERVNGVADWRAWGAAVMEQIRAAQAEADLSTLISTHQEEFAECAEKAPKAYRSLNDALHRRRRQIQAGV